MQRSWVDARRRNAVAGRAMLALFIVGVPLWRLTASGAPAAAAATARSVATPARDSAAGRLWLEMRNVDLHIDDETTMQVRELRGEVIRTSSGTPAALDDTKSFTVRVTSGTVALSGDAMSVLLNKFVFGYKGSPLKNLKLHTEGTQVVLKGTMHKGVDIPFTITSTPTLEPDGRVRLRPDKSRILGVDGQKLMHALGLHLDKLLDLKGATGASVKGDDVFLEPTKILPPPSIEGRLSEIHVVDGQIVQRFVRLPDDSIFDSYARPDSAASNYVFFRGGQLRFGRLLMSDTDLQIVDADERDPFDLNLERYAQQLIAGTSHTLPSLGLRVIMPDYRAVARAKPIMARADEHTPRGAARSTAPSPAPR